MAAFIPRRSGGTRLLRVRRGGLAIEGEAGPPKRCGRCASLVARKGRKARLSLFLFSKFSRCALARLCLLSVSPSPARLLTLTHLNLRSRGGGGKEDLTGRAKREV